MIFSASAVLRKSIAAGGRVRRPRAGDVASGNSTTLAADGASFGNIEKYRYRCSSFQTYSAQKFWELAEMQWLEMKMTKSYAQ